MSMKQIADWALNIATQRGAGYADRQCRPHDGNGLVFASGAIE